MVEEHVIPSGVRDPSVLRAMRHVPRHRFVPDRYADLAYHDEPLPIGFEQTISQPSLVALMTEALSLKKPTRCWRWEPVLDIKLPSWPNWPVRY